MTQISVLGCGWLGLPLAESLLSNGFLVHGSTTSSLKLPFLQNAKIIPFLISINANDFTGDLVPFLQNSKILIIAIPPRFQGNSSENFVAKIQNLIPFIEHSNVEKVIFISSTSVYADDNTIVTEETLTNPNTESGVQLLEAERLLLENKNFETTIIRFGGLIGEDRNPIKYLAGKKNLENPEAPINLIHLTDCIGIIETVLQKEAWGEIFNAVTPCHPTRKTYYTQKAIELNLPLPTFEENKPSFGKSISNEKVEKVLAYKFKKKQL